jgi:putative transposase
VLVEATGVPVGIAVDGANRNDMKMVRETLASMPVERPQPTPDEPQGLCMDKGYDYDDVRQIVEEFAFTAHIRSRGEEMKALKRDARTKARRWVVERTHSWMNRFRGILIRWNKKPQNYIAMLHFAFAIITYRCAGLIG